MSGCSGDAKCPACGEEGMDTYTDYKPHDTVSGQCLNCGFAYYTNVRRMSLGEINSYRTGSAGLPALKVRLGIDPARAADLGLKVVLPKGAKR